MLDIKITRTTCPKEKPQDESKLGFGKKFTDHMFVMDYTEGEAGMTPHRPLRTLPADPATVVFHYAQEIFEGMKAYRTADDTIQLFRPECNAKLCRTLLIVCASPRSLLRITSRPSRLWWMWTVMGASR